MTKLAYRELEFVGGGGTRVPDGTGVLRELEGSWGDDDDCGSERDVVVVVSGGSDVTNKVVVVVKDGCVTVTGGGGAGKWRRLGENICAVIREEKERTGEGDYEGAANDSEGCECGSRVIDEGGGERALCSDDGAGGEEEKEGGPHRHGWKEGGGERSAEERHVLGRKSRGKRQT